MLILSDFVVNKFSLVIVLKNEFLFTVKRKVHRNIVKLDLGQPKTKPEW